MHGLRTIQRSVLVRRIINRRLLIGKKGSYLWWDRQGLRVSEFKGEEIMALSDMLMRVVGFLRAGYPEGVPAHDYVPLLALLRRRLSDDEVIIIVASKVLSGRNTPVDATDVRVAITKLTDEMPSPEETERVKQRLAAVGWPVTDSFGSGD
jgi:hypothetical protein